jgi:hypothetical protein
MYEFTIDDLDITPLSISKILYREAPLAALEMSGTPGFLDRFDKLYRTYTRFVEPFACSSPLDVGLFREIFGGSLHSDSPIYKAAEYWRESEIFIVSIGKYLEDSVQGLYERGELTEALFLDAVGSALVEALAEKLQNEIEKKYLPDQSTNGDRSQITHYAARYSPGYCGWDVAGQEALFGYLADMKLPVSITEAGMMHPRKSISGIMAIEKRDPQWNLYAACRMCKKRCGLVRRPV